MNQGDRFLIYQDRRGLWRWRLTRSNNRVIADSAEGYRDRRAAMLAAYRVIDAVRDATVWDH